MKFEQTSGESYRPDIDGLRALAVCAVVMFHAFPGILPAGFVGVDVFFVISGFLISRIILRKLFAGHFSLVEFYSNRARRIFPALIVVLGASLGFGWLALLSDEYSQLGKHVTAGVLFFQNFCLRSEAGYFDTASELKPLMHLWSLSIEEQFYVIYPAILMFLWRSRRRLVLSLIFLFLASLGANILRTPGDSASAFFLPQYRAWELIAGSLVGLVSLWNLWPGCDNTGQNEQRCSMWRHLASGAGFALVIAAVALLSRHVPYPGWRALLPVCGTALMIIAGPRAIVNRFILADKRLVFVGLISYPFYLWHWILLSFGHIIESSQPAAWIRTVLVVLSFGLAFVTYRYIEVPIRYGRRTWLIPVALTLVLLGLGVMGYQVYSQKGIPARDKDILSTSLKGNVSSDAFFKHVKDNYYRCTPENIAATAVKELDSRCYQSKVNRPVDIALIGDSHAEHLFLGLAAAMPTKNIAYYIQKGPPDMGNPAYNDIYSFVLNEKNITDVILGMHWARMPFWDDDKRLGEFFLSTARSVLKAGKRMWVLSDIPSIPFQPQRCMGRRRFASGTMCKTSREVVDKQMSFLSRGLRKLLEYEPRVRYLDIMQYVCSEKWCNVNIGDILLYRDDSHVTIEGSVAIAEAIVRDHPELVH
jgi:peptidoglycan/LPS O-acetylase OafA/YrhL